MFTVDTSISINPIFLIEYQLKNLNNIENLKRKIDQNVGIFDYKTNVKGKMTNYDLFIKDFNFLTILKELEDEVLKYYNYKNYYLYNAWGNILEKNDEIIEHHHISYNEGYPYCTGIIYLTENGSGTYFKQFNKTISEKIGKVALFSMEAIHSVPKHIKDEKRYTISFDLRY